MCDEQYNLKEKKNFTYESLTLKNIQITISNNYNNIISYKFSICADTKK